MRTAMAVWDADDAVACLAATTLEGGDLTLISVSRMPLTWLFAPSTGFIDTDDFEREAAEVAADVARTAMKLLRPSTGCVYAVSHGLRSRTLRRYLVDCGCDELILVGRRWQPRTLFARLALRGSGISVRSVARTGQPMTACPPRRNPQSHLDGHDTNLATP